MTLEKQPWLMSGLIVMLLAMPAASRIGADEPPQVADQPQVKPPAYGGSELFRTYCSSCHGTAAKGDGPVAEYLRPRPADLTQIAKQNNGVFPAEKVAKTIDGRERVRPHGNSQMPVWGDAFSKTADAPDQASVKRKIDALVTYLESIQERPAKTP